MELGGCVWIHSCGSLLEAENWSGSAPLQVVHVEEHVDTGPLRTAWSRFNSQAEAVTGTLGPMQDTYQC